MTTAKNLIMRSVIVLFLFLISFYAIPGAYALDVVTDPNHLGRTLGEGETIEFTMNIYGYPHGDNYTMTLETSLERCGESPIYEFIGFNEEYIEGDRFSPNIKISSLPSTGIRVDVKGRTPSVRTEHSCEDLKIVEFDSGPFKYYNIKISDPSGQNLISEEKTDYFDVRITENEIFQKKLDKLTKKEGFTYLKYFVSQLHEKHLVDEANELADLLLNLPTPECKVNYPVLIAILFIGLLCGGLISYRKGYKKGYDDGLDDGLEGEYDDGITTGKNN